MKNIQMDLIQMCYIGIQEQHCHWWSDFLK